ncbi:MAG: transposase [Terriglobia bacterium]
MAYDPKAHHRRSIRLRGWDYARPGLYFVTVCTQGKEHVFGAVADGEMRLNEYGRNVAACWEELPRHYPRIRVDGFIVMPNHVHGIIEILDVGAGLKPAPTVRNGIAGAGLKPAPTRGHSVSEIVRAFKTFSARGVNRLRRTAGKPLWQRNYYEHIIRNELELAAIQEYIASNPVRWDTDPENPAATMASP